MRDEHTDIGYEFYPADSLWVGPLGADARHLGSGGLQIPCGVTQDAFKDPMIPSSLATRFPLQLLSE